MKLILGKKENIDYIEDVSRIEKVLEDNGYIVKDLYVVQDLWRTYSSNLAAGWLSVTHTTDEDIMKSIETVLEDFIVVKS